MGNAVSRLSSAVINFILKRIWHKGKSLKMSRENDGKSNCGDEDGAEEKRAGFSQEKELEKFKRPKRLLDVAYQSWKSGQYTDVTIVIGEKRFAAHRLVLASLSDYFPPLLKLDQRNSGEVPLEMPEPEVFDVLLKYAYTGEVDITKENVQDVLIGADYLVIDHVKEVCIRFMTANLDNENVSDVLMFASEHSLKDLIENTKQFLEENLDDVSKTESFYQLDPEFLVTFFDDDNLVLYSNKAALKTGDREKVILNTVLRYLSVVSKTPEIVERMIRSVRLSQIHKDVIEESLSNFETLKNNEVIKKYIKLGEVAEETSEKVKHSEAQHIPDSWFRLRKYGKFSISSKRERYSAGGHIQETPDPPAFILNDHNVEIKRIEIWLRTWDGKIVIGGLSLSYRNSSLNDCSLVYRRGLGRGTPPDHVVELEPGEFIIKVTIGSGYLIDRLCFKTNKGNVFGPFGGPGGGERTEEVKQEEAKPDSLSYLFDINCDTVVTQHSESIFNLMLRWITFS